MEKNVVKVLIADDDEFVLLSVRLLLEQHGMTVLTTNTPERIPSLLERESIQAVILDMNFRQGDTTSTQGLFWLGRIKELNPDLPVLLMTAYGEIPLAVEAMKQGALDFITKPWQNEKLVATTRNAIALYQERSKVKQLTSQQRLLNASVASQYEGFIGNDSAIAAIRRKIEKIAPTDTAVLILGENGTGKEVVARAIHKHSARTDNVFISVDLGSLSENIFESELFGHKKGSFTDAREDRIGRFEAANGGTLFLDEIGNLSLGLQAKLLTALQHKVVTRLGTNNPVATNVRIICATNRNLRKLVDEGTFREDLYYRINTIELHIPPLRERPDDIPLIADFFLRKFRGHYSKPDRYIDETVSNALKKYHWPGNIRELQHAVERAVLLSESPALSLEDFGVTRHDHSDELIFDQLNLEKLEAWAIRKAVAKHKGNISHAAEELGLSRGAMYRRMERYGI